MKKGPADQDWTPTINLGGLYPMQAASTLVIYDLRDPEAWMRAHRERAAWGKSHTVVHVLDSDHVVLEFRAGGAALEASA